MEKKIYNNTNYNKDSCSGVILLVVLWMLAILSILAIGLGRRTSIDLSLTKYSVGKTKARYIAWAGFMHALKRINDDAKDPVKRNIDTVYECGVAFKEDETSEVIFKNISLGDGYFEVSYRSGADGSKKIYGLQDEERRININAINYQNYVFLSELISLVGFDDEAKIIASSVIDWKDSDSKVTNDTFGAESDYYQSQTPSYNCKNALFESIEELLLVRGMTKEIFSKIKDYITIFPYDFSNLSININTASDVVLRAISRSISGADIADADSMVEKIISYRSGEDAQEGTQDDREINHNEIAFNQKERVIFFNILSNTNSVASSKYIRICVKGFDERSSVSSDIEAIVQRDDNAVVYWLRN